jgi:hypothetical protein
MHTYNEFVCAYINFILTMEHLYNGIVYGGKN